MEKGTGAILLVIGVVALFAAIVGGGVKIKEIEVGSLPSRWRQGMLAIFGAVIGITGLVMVSGILDSGSGNTAAAGQNAASTDQDAEANTAGADSTVSNAADENAGDATGSDANSSQAANDSNSDDTSQQ